MLKRIVTIQDISCFGKCSLTVAHPILSAMGIETAVIPTAVLSTHTGGFTGYTFRDLTSDIPAIAKHWQSLQLQFDGIYTGYLGSKEQVQIVSDFFQTFRSAQTKIIVDPVMGDGGKLYPGFTADFVQEMKTLCQRADVIVPNMTEASLLLDCPYRTDYNEKEIQEILRALTDIGTPIAVLTGVQYGDGNHGAVAYDSSTNTYYAAFRKHIDQAVHGTGDIFSSLLSGAIVKGASLEKAVQLAVNLTTDCIEATLPDRETYWYGVSFESCMGKIAQEAAAL
ncbi:MAG: pyridoxamine kinase [Oscillospiraceae bacterium]|nr:pyridoxamine kinase [Oscillospiraceae bacterium]MDD7295613.1 pyridoxamine kinase [Oscillospiraceae bacterium]